MIVCLHSASPEWPALSRRGLAAVANGWAVSKGGRNSTAFRHGTQRLRCAILLALATLFACCGIAAADTGVPGVGPFRPPATPLIAVDPYFSVWSFHDFLTDGHTTHWTGSQMPLRCMIRIDGKVLRVIGTDPFYVPPMPQTGLEVTPTRSIYRIANDKVRLVLTFMTPSLPYDLDILSRPASYMTWKVASNDGKEHDVTLYLETSALLTVNTPDQRVTWDRPAVDGLTVLRIGSQDQPILAKKGDDLRIDWGYLYVATPNQPGLQTYLGNGDACRGSLLTNSPLPKPDDSAMPRPAGEAFPSATVTFDLGKVDETPVSRYVIFAYDDLYSIEFMGQRLRPYWRRNGAEAADMLKQAAKDYEPLTKQCEAFDKDVIADLTAAGGPKYAQIASLAYRQCMAAGKLAADANGMPLYFCKECFSNACISTVDVIYPSSPQLLLFNPMLLEASLEPVLLYAESPRWKWPFAPHDIGTYPLADGQVYGGGEETETNQMPVEESANMLLMMAAIAKAEGNADFSAKHWAVLTKWAEYLKSNGMDPKEQLCTDDFTGHLAHNVNLSAKSILALGAFAQLCDRLGKRDEAESYRKLAQGFAVQWTKMANDGDHYRLAFDRSGTWSQKYNLIWNRVLNLDLFPPEVAREEIAFYRTKLTRYGLPLDIRQNSTKLDWMMWTGALTGDRKDFEPFVNAAFTFLNESPSRVPMTDWYWTDTGRIAIAQARPVVGALYVGLLGEPAVWKKWAARAKPVPGHWAPLEITK